MITTNEDITTKPLIKFLQNQLRQLAPLFNASGDQQLEGLREHLEAMRFKLEPDSPFQPYHLIGGQALEPLNLSSLNACLAANSLPPAHFMSQPPAFFDSALVPLWAEMGGSGYLFFWSASLPASEVYYLLAHAWGHLALGHLRQGDVFSHWDVVSDLRHEAGPARRWDKSVQQMLPHWFEPLTLQEKTPSLETVEWLFPSFTEAFERLCHNQLEIRA